MDLVCRYWDQVSNKVTVRHLNSAFMGDASSEDILESFKSALNPIAIEKIIQISMDGPNVNWKFLELYNNELREGHQKTLLNLGSCGLHVLHGSLQTGHSAAKWNVNSILRSMFNSFKQSQAGRADFSAINPELKLPKKFCQTRWIENVDVYNRAIDVYNNVKDYLAKTKKLPDTKTVETLKTAIQDPLTVPKIMFFSSASSLVEPYLRKFQSPQPMMPFVYGELIQVLHPLYSRFIKQEVIEEANTTSKLLKLVPKDSKLWCDPS